jgi:zinc transport system ATP-binding protein
MLRKNTMPKAQRKPCGLCCTQLKDFGVTIGGMEILYNINFRVNCGELTGLVGPNGAGKTTLLRAILGEVKHVGELSFLDSDNQRSKPVVGYVPQRLDYDHGAPISVMDLFAACLTNRPVCLGHSKKLKERVLDDLSKVDAGHLLDRRLGDLSGGELQRVMLAVALDPNPDLLLLDEPVSGIDVQGKEIFYKLVLELCRQYDLSIILVSHDWPLISRYANRIILLDRTVKSCGTPEDVFTDDNILKVYGPSDREEFGQIRFKPQVVQDGGVNI